MSEEENKKSNKIFEKIVMGAVIGGAIGSVIGASVKGKGSDEAEEKNKKHKGFISKILGIFRKKNGVSERSVKKIPNEMEEYKK